MKIFPVFVVAGVVAGEVRVVDKENFEKEISMDERVMVAFTMAGCEHCEEFRPEFAELCGNFSKCLEIEDVSVGTKFQVEGFPTVGIFEKKYFKKFSPEKEIIGNFLAEKSEISGSLNSSRMAFAISDQADSKLAEEFRLARKFLEISGQAEFVETKEISDPQEISVFRDGVKKGTWKFPDLVKSGLSDFFSGERIPLFGEVTRDNYELYEYLTIGKSEKFPGRGLVWVCFDPEAQTAQREATRATVEDVARKFRKNFSFVWVDTKIYGDEAQRQIGCKMDDRKFPALVVHIHGERPASLRRHQFNGNFDALEIFFENIDQAPYFFRSKANVNKALPVPEISSRELEEEISSKFSELLVGVTVTERELCAEACDKFISDLAVIRALVGDKISVRRLDGLENDPPRPFVFWENVPYLFLIKNGNQIRFPTQDGFALSDMLLWLKANSGLLAGVELPALESEAEKRKFIDTISDLALKTEVQNALFPVEDEWDEEVTTTTTSASPVDDWDDLDDEL